VRALTGRPPVALIVVIVVVAGLLAAFLVGSPRQLESYRVVDDDTIVVSGIKGRYEICWVRTVEESEDRVVISVRSVELPLPHGDVGIPFEVEVNLHAPLRDRAVSDAWPRGGGDLVRTDHRNSAAEGCP
jgi:hypothetical protein